MIRSLLLAVFLIAPSRVIAREGPVPCSPLPPELAERGPGACMVATSDSWQLAMMDGDSLVKGSIHSWQGEIGTLFDQDYQMLKGVLAKNQMRGKKQLILELLPWGIPVIAQILWVFQGGIRPWHSHISQEIRP